MMLCENEVIRNQSVNECNETNMNVRRMRHEEENKKKIARRLARLFLYSPARLKEEPEQETVSKTFYTAGTFIQKCINLRS